MLKVYIYWHKCSCYYARRRTNEQLKMELLSLYYIRFSCLVIASSWLGLSSMEWLQPCIHASVIESTQSQSYAGSISFNYTSSIWSTIFGMLHVKGMCGRQEGCLGGRLRQVAGKLATARSRWVVAAYTPYITCLPAGCQFVFLFGGRFIAECKSGSCCWLDVTFLVIICSLHDWYFLSQWWPTGWCEGYVIYRWSGLCYYIVPTKPSS